MNPFAPVSAILLLSGLLTLGCSEDPTTISAIDSADYQLVALGSPPLKATALSSTPEGDSLFVATPESEGGDCDPMTAVLECHDPNPGGSGQWVFFGVADSNLYEAPGDPNPGAAGVWLGSSVSPSACFTTGRGAVSTNDRDGDGLANQCEYSIARSFAPQLNYYQAESCPAGEPRWAAKRFPNGVVRIAYMMSYYQDCGYGGHAGDSEMVTVQVRFNEQSRHWEFDSMWLSAHYGGTVDKSGWVTWAGTEYRSRYRAFPIVYVAEDKHANYRSVSACQWAHGDNSLHPWEDWCGSSSNPATTRIRFPVAESGNAGSRYRDLLGCVVSVKYPNTGRTECFYANRGDGFRGWNAGSAGVTSYYNMLLGGPAGGLQFEYYYVGSGLPSYYDF